VDYVIPANDDSTVSVDYILDKLSTSILNGYESSAKKVEGKF
jgi:ribosomal protein S2